MLETNAEAASRQQSGWVMIVGGFCVIGLALISDANVPVRLCNCWKPLTEPSFVVVALGHILSTLLIYSGARKLDPS